MNINIEGDRITVEDSKIDIYGAVELGKALAALKADGGGSVKVDLSRVERLSMPAVQV
ncbi:MAG: hypothetical protein GWO38_08425, partial [Phycisphaerae bacterium]|nr:hypothetical protein [Phycisphaerae bacterium]NIW98735.1 hypothetical protein [Phycisphaerae bacterium]NIX27647.1 hypothetical protein [Phycisphaerae bacterium]